MTPFLSPPHRLLLRHSRAGGSPVRFTSVGSRPRQKHSGTTPLALDRNAQGIRPSPWTKGLRGIGLKCSRGNDAFLVAPAEAGVHASDQGWIPPRMRRGTPLALKRNAREEHPSVRPSYWTNILGGVTGERKGMGSRLRGNDK
jgi:hypothetical protein